jgi:hypothetical protein
MALGDLSADQQRYRDLVAAGVPLDPRVVTAWIGTESGWGVTKPSHNYLNVGPGRSYPSTDAAARDAIAVAHQPNMKIGGATPQAQLQSIVISPWGTGSTILDVYSDLYQDSGGSPLDQAGTALEGAAGGAAGALGDAFGWVPDLVNALGKALFSVVLGFAFTATALGLIVLGVSRLTGQSVTARARQTATTAVGAAGVAAAVA